MPYICVDSTIPSKKCTSIYVKQFLKQDDLRKKLIILNFNQCWLISQDWLISSYEKDNYVSAMCQNLFD